MSRRSDVVAVPSSHRQLLLTFEPPAGKTFETFVPTGNGVAVRHLKQLCAEPGHHQLYLWGEASVGKSHLLQAACRAVNARGGRSVWLPLNELLSSSADVLADLASINLVALDNLDVIAADFEWQCAVFNLINEARVSGCRLLMAGRRNPAAIGFQLKDLPSRLLWGASYRLMTLDDAGKMEALRRISERLGCIPAADALPYLMGNHPRELARLVATVERLARAAKEHKRRITVPFIKEILPGA